MRTTLLFMLAPVALSAQLPDTTRVADDTTRTLETVTVSAIRAREEAPISAKVLDREEIERRSFGQDIPILLQGTPSLTSYAETGNYWGYSYLRLRGIDQSRINFTLDGIPLNDPEDQVLYFADFPDLANSIGSVQVQRGVGTSAPGTASYGGSINFQTVPLLTSDRETEVQVQGGSFGSARGSLEYTSGLLAKRFAMYARGSALQSEGYRHGSGMTGRSAFLSAAYVGERDILKLTALAGLFADTLSYLGATRAELTQDRRFNPLRRDEVDRFGEQVAALTYTRQVSDVSTLATTLYRIAASGNYDVCIARCDQPQADLWNFNLDFAWYGATTVWSLEQGRMRASIGANANTYDRDHHAYARPDLEQPLYRNTGHKDDASAFAKMTYDVGPVRLFGDVQGRYARFSYTPDVNAGIASSGISWTFLNPKIGATLRMSPSIESYASFGANSREPARSDMFAGFDNLDTSNVTFVGPFGRVRPERAHDLEAGLRLHRDGWSLDANAFLMEFRNEILPVGQLSYIGTPLRTNVGSSWRRGVEMDMTVIPHRALELAVTATAMRARIAEFTDDEAGITYRGVDPLLTPKFTSAQRITLDVTRSVAVTLSGQYSSTAQLTNTNDPTLTLPAYYLANATAEWMYGPVVVALHLNNLTDSRRFASGHVSFGEARYYVLPPRNVFLQARIRL